MRLSPGLLSSPVRVISVLCIALVWPIDAGSILRELRRMSTRRGAQFRMGASSRRYAFTCPAGLHLAHPELPQVEIHPGAKVPAQIARPGEVVRLQPSYNYLMRRMSFLQ